jgi:glycerate-2-kinase
MRDHFWAVRPLLLCVEKGWVVEILNSLCRWRWRLKEETAHHVFMRSPLATDGLDGTSCAAGAWISPTTLSEARLNGLSPRKSLDDNDSATLLNIAGALIHTGPTFTNINDFRAVLIE